MIREIEAADFQAIASLSPANGPDTDYETRCIKQAEACLVATLAGSVVGYITLDYSFYGNGFISFLFVTESVRRSGVGLALIREIGRRCKTPKLFTSTNESNSPMRGLLTVCGFTESGIIHNLDDGDPEIVYFRSPHCSTT